MTATHYQNVSQGRAHFKDLLDAAEAGRPASVRRLKNRAAVVDAEKLRLALATLRPARAEVVREAGGWSIFIRGLPVAADGSDFDEALDEMCQALREYAEDWSARLLTAPNHAENWAVVQIIELSTDQQLKDWLVGR